MPRTPRDVTEAELGVLRVLWERGPSSVRQIVEAFDKRPQAATIQKLLERLESKGAVERDRSEAVQRFRAVADRDEIIGRRLQGIAEELCEGSLAPLISHLAKRERLSASDRQALRDLIAQLEKNAPPARRSKRA
jgi:BlaI family transcriptional regulator, penicillinase repressor